MDTWIATGLGLVHFALSVIASGHAVLFKRDVRAAVGWLGVIWLVPGVGPFLYALLGINRIRTRARALRGELAPKDPPLLLEPHEQAAPETRHTHLRAIANVVDRLVPEQLLPHNSVELLDGGDAAYPSMLAAIDAAERSVILETYIFDNDEGGRAFVDALARAQRRGVEVRVLIDGAGVRYSFPPVTRVLRKAGVPVARFLPPLIPWAFPYANLRTHRKILVVDGEVAFTGGMNIRVGHWLSKNPSHPIRDLHVRLEGPVVEQLLRVAVIDWGFAAREQLRGEAWASAPTRRGNMWARVIPDGPDADFETVRMTLLGALAGAERRVRIVTPYFVPDTALLTALGVTAMQGIEVDIVMPAHNNLALVQWASVAQLWQLAERGCRLWFSDGIFDHTKLMVVDDGWVLLGSANWDARSLRLNFEVNLEVYNDALAAEANALIDRRLEGAREVTLAELDGRPFPVRLRDGLARLLSPYL